MRRIQLLAVAAVCAMMGTAWAMSDPVDTGETFRDRPPEDEIVYFVLPDRFENGDTTNDTGGFEGGPLDHGFNPFYKIDFPTYDIC